MPNYFTSTKNPIARAGIIRKLMAKGYALYAQYSVSDYFTNYPAHEWPIVIVRTDGEFATRPIIDLMKTMFGIPADAVKVSPAQIERFPDAHVTPILCGCAEIDSPTIPIPVFPEAAKYSLDYVKADGTKHNYTISNPIEADCDSITAYAFGRGVRTFKKARVRGFSKVS